MTATTQGDNLKRFILIDSEYRPENITFNLWVRKGFDGFELMAVSLAGTEIDLMEALSDGFIQSAEAHIDRIYLQCFDPLAA